MATSSENDDRAEGESEPETENTTESSGEGDEAQAGEAEEKASAAPAAAAKKSAAAPKARKGEASAKAGRPAPKRGAKPARAGASASSSAAPVRKQGGSLGKSVVLFVIIVGGLAAAFAAFNSGGGGDGGRATPNWKTGQQVDVELTLVKTDKDDLACSSAEELSGRHCAFEAQNKKWSKDTSGDDKKLLKPYTTTNGAELLAAGLWSEPALSGTLPATRFSVKCKYTVEGKLKKPGIRWASDRPWYDNGGDWYSGVVSGCAILP